MLTMVFDYNEILLLQVLGGDSLSSLPRQPGFTVCWRLWLGLVQQDTCSEKNFPQVGLWVISSPGLTHFT